MKKFFLKTLMQIQSSLYEIHIRSLEIMATVEEVKVAVQAVRDAATAEKAQVQEKLDALSTQISDLAAQVAAGVSPDQLDGIVSDLNQAASDVANIFTPSEAAPQEPVAEAPVEEAPVEAPAEAPAAPLDETTPQPLLP